MAYNLTLYNNATGIMGIFEATNYMSGNILSIMFILSLAFLSYWVLAKNNNPPAVNISITAFGTLLISLLFRVREFQGVPLVPDWFIITNIMILAFAMAGLYLTKNR